MENGDLTVLLEGLSADSYDNTFFISQKGASGSRLAGELHAYMSNLEHAGDAGIDVKGALKLLDARRRQAEAEKKKVQEAARERMKEQQARLDYVAQEEERLRDQEAECEERLRKVEEERAEAGRKIRAQESREKACQTQGARARETCLQREEDGSFPKKGVPRCWCWAFWRCLAACFFPATGSNMWPSRCMPVLWSGSSMEFGAAEDRTSLMRKPSKGKQKI